MTKLPKISHLNTKQMRELIAYAEALLEERRQNEIRAGKAKVEAIAKELGVPVRELLGGRMNNVSKKSPGAPPKYRSKTDPSLTWSGRGRMATWLANEVKAGKRKETFLIKR